MSADFDALRNGYFGLIVPTAVIALVMATATVCSRYPSIGSELTTIGSRFGGSLLGNFKFEYCCGFLIQTQYATNHFTSCKTAFYLDFVWTALLL